MSKEMSFDDIDYDNMNGSIGAEIEPIIEDCSFTGHNGFGLVQSFGGNEIVGFKVLSATFFEVGNNGEELREFELDPEIAKELIEYDEDNIIGNFTDYLEE